MTERPPGWRRLLRLPTGKHTIEGDVDEEIAFHLAMRAERLRTRGLAPDDATAAARNRFGDLDDIRRECVEIDRELVRRRRAADSLEELVKDITFALRGLRRAPGFAAAALLTLALGIGAATAIFSVAYGVLLRPLPFANPDRLMDISVDATGDGKRFGNLSAPEYFDLAKSTRAFSSVAAWTPRDRTLGGDGKPERINTASVTGTMFGTLGARPAMGRLINADDDVAPGAMVVVITDGLWRTRYGSDPSIVGKRVDIDGIPRTVIGVLPSGVGIRSAQAFTPMGFDPARLPGRGAHYLRIIGRLKAGVSIEQAIDDMHEFAKRTRVENPTNYGKNGIQFTTRPLRDAWFGDARPTMQALLATVMLLLLLAAVNVANLLLVRAEARQREMGVRVALGASRRRLVRQLLTESILLSSMGALIGIPLTVLSVRSLLAINPGVVPPGAEVSVDFGVMAAVIGVVVLAALIAGVAPALRAGSTDVRTAIATGSAGGAKVGGRLRSILVATEVALATAMLIGAGLVGRSFQRLLAVDPGFDSKGVLVMDVALPRVRYDTSTKILSFYQTAVERLRALPGVTSAASLTTLPLGSGTIGWSLVAEGRPSTATELSTPFLVNSSFDIFRALGVRILRGRGFTPEDNATGVPVTVVSEALAKEFWPGEEPLGKRVKLSGEDEWVTVVGVARDVRPEALSERPKSTYYLTMPQFEKITGIADAGMTFVLRTSGDPMALKAGAREAIRQIDPELALKNVQSLASVVENSVSRPRFAASVLGSFGVVALVLAIIGVYGVLSFAMARRRRELAVRMALGAHARDVTTLVMKSGLGLAAIGVAVGLAAALAGGKLLEALLYDIKPTDPATLGAVVVMLLAAAAAASWLPARRATTVSPAEVLRGE